MPEDISTLLGLVLLLLLLLTEESKDIALVI
jgi:hypothetical protein